MCRKATVLKAESHHVCSNELWLGCEQKKFFKRKIQNFVLQIFFGPRSLTRYPQSTPESFTLMGPALCESISYQLGKSPVLSYQSLACFARSALIITSFPTDLTWGKMQHVSCRSDVLQCITFKGCLHKSHRL